MPEDSVFVCVLALPLAAAATAMCVCRVCCQTILMRWSISLSHSQRQNQFFPIELEKSKHRENPKTENPSVWIADVDRCEETGEKNRRENEKKKSAPNANVYRYIVFIIHVLLRINIENWRHTILCVWYSLFHHRWLYWTIFGRCFMGSKIKNAPLRISVQCSAGCRACVMARTTYEKEAFVRYTCKTFAFLVSKLYLFQTRKR